MLSQRPAFSDSFHLAEESDYYLGGCTGGGISIQPRCLSLPQFRLVSQAVASPWGDGRGDLTLSLWKLPDIVAVARQPLHIHLPEKKSADYADYADLPERRKGSGLHPPPFRSSPLNLRNLRILPPEML